VAPQGTVVVVASYLELVLQNGDHTMRTMEVVVVSRPRTCELDFLVRGMSVVRDSMSVQNDEWVTEVLTWEEMDSCVVQVY
jgi:hypothetical protein